MVIPWSYHDHTMMILTGPGGSRCCSRSVGHINLELFLKLCNHDLHIWYPSPASRFAISPRRWVRYREARVGVIASTRVRYKLESVATVCDRLW